MPSAVKTPNIGLNQWSGNEYFKRQDFVDDNIKIDEEIRKLIDSIGDLSTLGTDEKTNLVTAINEVLTKLGSIKLEADKVTIKDLDNLFISDKVEGALNEVMKKANEAFQSGVNAKAGMKNAINSKVTVPDVSDSDNWDTYIQRVQNIKEGRGNAQVGNVLSGKTFTNDSGNLLTGTMPNKSGTTNVNGILDSIKDLILVPTNGYYDGANAKLKITQSHLNYHGYIYGGKKFASGFATATVPSGYYSSVIEVAGLSFKPSIILMVAKESSYNHFGFYYPSVLGEYNIYGYSQSGYTGSATFADVGTTTSSKVYVTSNAFKLYVSGTSWYKSSIQWIAFE